MCDTFLALSSATSDGSVIFGKNSDREPNEAQALEYHPPRVHNTRENVQCTYLTIPQVKETFGEQFDECHPQLIETARKRGWLKRGRTFHFGRCYSDWFYTTFSASHRRRDRSCKLMEACQGSMDILSASRILRDHQGMDYRPDSHFLGDRICAHAANKLARNATQTTGSMIADLKPDGQTYYVTDTSAPCTGFFKPIRFGRCVLPDIGPTPGSWYDPDALWWFHESLHRMVLLDFETRPASFCGQRDELEKSWVQQSGEVVEHQWWGLTKNAFRQARQMTGEWIEHIRSLAVQHRNKWMYQRYWQSRNQKIGLSYFMSDDGGHFEKEIDGEN